MVGAAGHDPLIRPATPDDLTDLVDLYLESAEVHAAMDPGIYRVPDRPATETMLRGRVAGQGDHAAYVVAVVADRIVGSANMVVAGLQDPGSMRVPARIAEFGVAVAEAWRGQGIGRALITYLERWAFEHGADLIILDVNEANPEAIRLYRTLGYVESQRIMRKPA